MDDLFSDVYERNIHRVYRSCLLLLNNRADAEDAAQTVFIKYLRTKPIFSDEGHEKAWFLVTTRNYCRDILKSWWRRNRTSFDEIPNKDMKVPMDDEESSAVIDSLMELAPKYREVLYLYYIEGYSVSELAILLHRNESTLRTQLSVGRKKLKTNWEVKYGTVCE